MRQSLEKKMRSHKLTYLWVLIFVCSSADAQQVVTKQYVFPSWFHQLLSTVFSDERNDCTNSFYPPVPNVDYLNGLISATLGPRIVGFIPMKRWLPPSYKHKMDKGQHERQEKVTDIIRILPSGIVCFGMHKLNRRFPKNPFLRSEYIKALNKFISYLNSQAAYPHKIEMIV